MKGRFLVKALLEPNVPFQPFVAGAVDYVEFLEVFHFAKCTTLGAVVQDGLGLLRREPEQHERVLRDGVGVEGEGMPAILRLGFAIGRFRVV